MTARFRHTRALLLGVLLSGCAYHAPDAPTSTAATTDPTAPFSMSMGSTVGFNSDAGHATILIKVQDVSGHPVAGATASFTTDAGTITPSATTTAADGTASASLTSPSTSTVIVKVGTLTQKMLVASEPVPAPPPVTPPPTGGGPPSAPPPAAPAITMLVTGTAQTGSVVSFGISGTGGANPSTWGWSFGDGAALSTAAPFTTHTYTAVGSYTATVIDTDGLGRSAISQAQIVVTLTPPPPPVVPSYTVAVAAAPASVVAGQSTTLIATVTPVNGAPAVTNYAWDCKGDGTAIVNTASPTQTCTYPTVGSTTSRLVVTGGTATGSGAVGVSAVTAIPIVTVGCSVGVTHPAPVNCVVSATLNGVAVPSASITSVAWDFGDGQTDITALNVDSHPYAAALTYQLQVVATVTGATGTGIGTTTVVIL